MNLGQAGHNPEGPVPLARVFIDLPVGERDSGPLVFGAGRLASEPPDQATGIAELLKVGGRRLDPASTPPERTTGLVQVDLFEASNARGRP